MDNAVEGILILKPDGNRGMPRITFVNGGFTRITGLAPRAVLGETLSVLPVVEDDLEAAAALRRALYAGAAFHRDGMKVRRADGTECVFELQLRAVPEGSPPPSHWVGILRDVTERLARARRPCDRRRYRDELTDLPNRTSLLDRLDVGARARAAATPRAAGSCCTSPTSTASRRSTTTLGHHVGRRCS